MTAPDPRLGEIEAIPEIAVATAAFGFHGAMCEPVSFPEDWHDEIRAALEAAAPHMHAYLLAELRKRDQALAMVEALAGELEQEATASNAVVNNVRYSSNRLSDMDRLTITQHEHHSTIAVNHAARIRAAVTAAMGGGDRG